MCDGYRVRVRPRKGRVLLECSAMGMIHGASGTGATACAGVYGLDIHRYVHVRLGSETRVAVRVRGVCA